MSATSPSAERRRRSRRYGHVVRVVTASRTMAVTGLRKVSSVNCAAFSQESISSTVVDSPAAEIQSAFNEERKESQASRFEDDAAVRKQTIGMYGRLSDLQNAVAK